MVLTDRDIRPAQLNLEHNRHNLDSNSTSSTVRVSELEWGASVLSFQPPYDLVLAADVIYVEESYPALIQTLLDLTGPRSLVLLSSKHRYQRDDRFFQRLARCGKFEDRVVHTWPGREEVKIHQLRRTDL